jgi:hypothetical protein
VAEEVVVVVGVEAVAAGAEEVVEDLVDLEVAVEAEVERVGDGESFKVLEFWSSKVLKVEDSIGV